MSRARHGIRFNEHIECEGSTVFAHACKLGLEDIVSKQGSTLALMRGGCRELSAEKKPPPLHPCALLGAELSPFRFHSKSAIFIW